MIGHRVITAIDIERAARINDAVVEEHGKNAAAAMHLGDELGIDIKNVIGLAESYSETRVKKDLSKERGQYLVGIAFTMGTLASLRAVKNIELERDC
jgi:hypothetical protein